MPVIHSKYQIEFGWMVKNVLVYAVQQRDCVNGSSSAGERSTQCTGYKYEKADDA